MKKVGKATAGPPKTLGNGRGPGRVMTGKGSFGGGPVRARVRHGDPSCAVTAPSQIGREGEVQDALSSGAGQEP